MSSSESEMSDNRKKEIIVKPVTLTVIAFVLTGTLAAQQPAFKRTVLQQGDISVPGREVISAVAEFQPGATPGRHTHSGEEVGYVLEGTFLVEQDGKAPVTQGRRHISHPRRHGSQCDEHRHRRGPDSGDVHRGEGQAARDARADQMTLPVTVASMRRPTSSRSDQGGAASPATVAAENP